MSQRGPVGVSHLDRPALYQLTPCLIGNLTGKSLNQIRLVRRIDADTDTSHTYQITDGDIG